MSAIFLKDEKWKLFLKSQTMNSELWTDQAENK